jgi:hypothetical protein
MCMNTQNPRKLDKISFLKNGEFRAGYFFFIKASVSLAS